MGGTEHLTVRREGATLVLTLNRPQARNALSLPMLVGLHDGWIEADEDDAIRSVVLTGAGGAFCAGMDLKALAADRARAGEAYAAWMGTLNSHDRLPLIAAVNGMAMGGGMEIALRCDLIVAGDHCEFGLPEVKGAMVPHGGALDFPSLVPMQTALEWGLLGERIPAARLRELGVVNRVVPGADVVPTAIALAQQIAAFDPDTVKGIRNGMWKR